MREKSFKAALLSGKCPSCRQGDVFKYPVSRIAHFSDMHDNCPHCGANFMPEPGFYYGSMFITYAFNVVLVITIGFLMYYFVDQSETLSLVVVGAAAVAVTPFSFRGSRILWLYWFGGLHYKPLA